MTGSRDRLVGEPALNLRRPVTSVRRHRVTPPAVTTGHREVQALDGVRALAVLAVLADHAGVPGLPGGFIGVDVFFVLSGFLITSLLLDEQRRTGRVDLAAFWARRARRLLPAAAVMVLTVGVCQQLFAPDSTAGLRGDALAALGWVANWRFAYQGTDYFSQGGTASPLQHTWSLGVEEQYYLIWPLILLAVTVLIARRSGRAGVHRRAAADGQRRALAVVAGTLAAVSALEAVVLAGHASLGRVYFATDTRAQALLIGALAACVFARYWPSGHRSRPQWTPRGRVIIGAVSITGLAVLAVIAHRATGSTAEFHHGLLTAVAFAAAAVIVGVTLYQDGMLARALTVRPLVVLGRISYGVYLWHWPVFLALDGARTGLSGLPLLILRCLITLAAASASWVLIEVPINRWRPVPVRLLPAAAATVALACALVFLVVPTDRAAVPLAASDLPPAADLGPSPGAAPEAAQPGPSPAPAPAPTDPNRPLTVDVFGDSIAWTLMRYRPVTPGVRFIDHTVLGCGITRGGPYRYFGQIAPQPPGCDNWPTTWGQQVAADKPDEVLLLVGRWETMDRLHDGQWMHLGDPAYDSYLSTELDTAVGLLGAGGARVVAATEPYNRRGEQPDGSLYPEDQPDRVARWNTLLRQAAARHPGTAILDLNTKLGPDNTYTATVAGITVRSDGVHLTPAGVNWLSPWLITALQADKP